MVKKILVLILFIISSNEIYSQKCETKKDPFTDENLVFFNYNAKTVYFELDNKKILFEIVFYYRGERNYEFKSETELLLKLEDETKIKLKTTRSSVPKIENFSTSSGFYPRFGGGMTMSSSENYTAYSFAFSLTPTELKKLAESQIDIIRIPDTDEGKHFDLEAKKVIKKKIKAIKKGATCMSEKI